jgi:hypothetical protein
MVPTRRDQNGWFGARMRDFGRVAVAWDSGENAVHTGETWVAPYGAGSLSLNGAVEVIVCCPPWG